ncbi:NAD-glutamate dehydrogenase [Streptomyces thinghirensis]|nr:NAD-glutamate dehydrogenase [Streptomyces thinghirensis]
MVLLRVRRSTCGRPGRRSARTTWRTPSATTSTPRGCSSPCSRRGWPPSASGAGREIVDALLEEVDAALDQVASLDEDRILRSFLTVIKATLRTNFFQEAAGGKPHDYVSAKFDPQAIPDLPAPRPAFEIWVYSPRVEGVHLRFGKVARGGLRWSDRRRTSVPRSSAWSRRRW